MFITTENAENTEHNYAGPNFNFGIVKDGRVIPVSRDRDSDGHSGGNFEYIHVGPATAVLAADDPMKTRPFYIVSTFSQFYALA